MTRPPGSGVYLTTLTHTPFGIFMPGTLVTVLTDHGGHVDLCMDNGFFTPTPEHICQAWTLKADEVSSSTPPVKVRRDFRVRDYRIARLTTCIPRNRSATA